MTNDPTWKATVDQLLDEQPIMQVPALNVHVDFVELLESVNDDLTAAYDVLITLRDIFSSSIG